MPRKRTSVQRHSDREWVQTHPALARVSFNLFRSSGSYARARPKGIDPETLTLRALRETYHGAPSRNQLRAAVRDYGGQQSKAFAAKGQHDYQRSSPPRRFWSESVPAAADRYGIGERLAAQRTAESYARAYGMALRAPRDSYKDPLLADYAAGVEGVEGY